MLHTHFVTILLSTCCVNTFRQYGLNWGRIMFKERLIQSSCFSRLCCIWLCVFFALIHRLLCLSCIANCAFVLIQLDHRKICGVLLNVFHSYVFFLVIVCYIQVGDDLCLASAVSERKEVYFATKTVTITSMTTLWHATREITIHILLVTRTMLY